MPWLADTDEMISQRNLLADTSSCAGADRWAAQWHHKRGSRSQLAHSSSSSGSRCSFICLREAHEQQARESAGDRSLVSMTSFHRLPAQLAETTMASDGASSRVEGGKSFQKSREPQQQQQLPTNKSSTEANLYNEHLHLSPATNSTQPEPSRISSLPTTTKQNANHTGEMMIAQHRIQESPPKPAASNWLPSPVIGILQKPSPTMEFVGGHMQLRPKATTFMINSSKTLMVHLTPIILCILLVSFSVGRIDCARRNDHWTERNATSFEQPLLGNLVAIGAISLLEPTTTPSALSSQRQFSNGILVDQIASPRTQTDPNGILGPTTTKINKLDYIVEFMRTNKLTKFCDLLTSEEPEIRSLNEKLNLLNQFTLFVPTNEAILLMPTSQFEQIKTSPQETKQFLLAHATSELVTPKSAATNQPEISTRSAVFSLAGSPLHVTSSGSGLAPSLAGHHQPRHLEMIVNGANIINGQSYALQEQNNNSATYAIVHLIDRVLYPVPSLKLRDMLRLVAPKMARYIELASDGLLDAQLSSISRLATMFAPNDDAFKSVPKKVIDQLDTNRTFLANFIRGHVIDGLYYGPQLTLGSEDSNGAKANSTKVVRLETFSGTELQFELKRLQSRNLILVNSIPIIEQDLVGLNGLIHVIARPIFEGHLSETCRCGLSNSAATQQVDSLRIATPNSTAAIGDVAAYERPWSTSGQNRPSFQDPGRQAVGTASGTQAGGSSVNWTNNQGDRFEPNSPRTGQPVENARNGNELEREESSVSSVAQQDKMALISQRIRAQRSGLVTRNNKDFYRPLAAPANLLMAPSGGAGDGGDTGTLDRKRQQQVLPAAAIVPPISIIEASDIQRQRATKLPEALNIASNSEKLGESGRLRQSSDQQQAGLAAPNGDMFEVERYKVILNAATRQRMREQQQQQGPMSSSGGLRQFEYDRTLVSPAAGGSSSNGTQASTRRPYSPINATSSPSANISGWSSGEQLTLSPSGNGGRQQRLLKFQPEDARDLAAPARSINITTTSYNAYSVLSDIDQQGASSSRQQQKQQLVGKTAAPTGSGYGGCAFYDTDCKRLFGRLVRLPTVGGKSQKVVGQQAPTLLNNSTPTPTHHLGTTEQHLDSTFGETTETPLGGGWTKSMPVQPQQQQASQKLQQPPVKAFHRLSPARVSPLNQPLPPWSDEERARPQLAPNWRAPDKDIARITGPYVGPDKKHHEPSQFGQAASVGFGAFTGGISRETPMPAISTKQPAQEVEQIYLTPVGVIQAHEFTRHHQVLQQNHNLSRPADPQELLKDGNKAIFVSPSPILRISQPARNPAPNRQQAASISFSSQQYHTPTPYSVSLVTTHLPPMFSNAPAATGAQFSRLTNFSAIDHTPVDQDQPTSSGFNAGSGSSSSSSNNKHRFGANIKFEQQLAPSAAHIPRPPAAHRKQRLQQLQMDNNGSLGANFDMNPASGEKQSKRIVRLQTVEQPARQTILMANEESLTNGDISITSARLNPSEGSSYIGHHNQLASSAGSLATQASNQAPNVSSSSQSNNLIRSAPLLEQNQATDFFQDRTIAEIMDDSGLRIEGQQVTFSRLKDCLREADLLSLVSQPGNSVTIFMPTDSAFQRLVQQQAIAQQRGTTPSSAGSSSRSGRFLDPSRRHLLPLVARRPKSLGTSAGLDSGRIVSGELVLTSGDLPNDDLSGATGAAERLTLDCSSSQLRQIMLDHLSARLITPKQLQHDLGISSLNGHQLLLSSVPSKKIVVVDGQPVIAATRAKNGMVYVVNKFLNLTQQVPNVVDLMETQPDLTTFLSYLRFSSLVDRLKREMGPLTVLAPTNEAFNQLSISARQLINSDPAALMDILRGHIVDGAQFGKLISMRNQLKTMNPDQKIEAKVIKPNVYLFDNQMTSMRLVGTTGNGVVNSIDKLIVPAWLKVTLGSSNPVKPQPQTPTGGSILFARNSGPSSFNGEFDKDSPFVSVATPSILGNSASLNLPVISRQPVRFEQPGNKDTFVGSPNNFLLADANHMNSIHNSTTTNAAGNNHINGRLDPFSGTTTTSSAINSLDGANSFLENNQSPFLRVANRLNSTAFSSANGPKRASATAATDTRGSPSDVNSNNVNTTTTTKNMQLIEKLANLMQARKFVKYLMRSRVSETLKPEMNYVILVPTDQAIEKLPKQIIDMLERDLERLADLMNYHILDTTFEYINTIPDGQTLNTLNEKDILFNWHRNNTILTASGAVVMGGIQEDNIALLIVDRVLYPTPGDILNIISKSPILSKFTSLVRNAGLESQLSLPGPYTLFAPSDYAFNQLDKRDLDALQRNKETTRRFLLRHLSQPTVFTSSIALSNGTQMLATNSLGDDLVLRQRNDYFSVNDVNFSYADVAATNGVVHVIDGLL